MGWTIKGINALRELGSKQQQRGYENSQLARQGDCCNEVTLTDNAVYKDQSDLPLRDSIFGIEQPLNRNTDWARTVFIVSFRRSFSFNSLFSVADCHLKLNKVKIMGEKKTDCFMITRVPLLYQSMLFSFFIICIKFILDDVIVDGLIFTPLKDEDWFVGEMHSTEGSTAVALNL